MGSRLLVRVLLGHELPHFGGNLRHRPDVRQPVQRNGDVEMIFEFSHQFEDLK
jgi:hypothetical protein